MKPLVFAAAAALILAGCNRQITPAWPSFGGDPAHGGLVIIRSSCGDCHVIPGVEGAQGQVGPPLSHFRQRTIVAGLLPNTPANLIHWLEHPQAVVPGNAMPDEGLTDQQARDVAAYLYNIP